MAPLPIRISSKRTWMPNASTASQMLRCCCSRFLILDQGSTRSREHEYVWRVAYPEEVLAGPDLEAQGEALAGWVIATITDLHAVLHG